MADEETPEQREKRLRERAQADPVSNPQPEQPSALQRLQDAGKHAAQRLGTQAERTARTATEQSVALLRDPVAARMVALLEGMRNELVKIAEGGGERQEMPPPGLFRTPFTYHVRIRATKWVVTVAAGGRYVLRAGANTLARLQASNGGTYIVDLPVTIDRGIDVAVDSETTETTDEAASAQTRIADSAATDTVGQKLAYTVPAGARAVFHYAGFLNNLGSPTVNLNLIRGGAQITLASGTAQRWVMDVPLQAGDTIELNVIVAAAAGSSSDFIIAVTEYASAAEAASLIDSFIIGYPE